MSRIISGRAKGMRLATPKGDTTRPTTDRVKEAVFSSLATWFGTVDADSSEQLADVAVLDLFAGSGGLGLEAASRGAGRVVCVDNRTAGIIRNNIATTGLPVEVNSGSVDAALKSGPGQFDLVFIDPPYDLPTSTVERVLSGLVADGALLPQALVVVERSKRSEPPTWPEPFGDRWERGYGETTLHFGALREEQE